MDNLSRASVSFSLTFDSPFHSKNRDSAQQLWVEVRGFLGHHIAAERDLRYLVDANRIQQKRELRFAAVYRRERRIHFAFVADIFFARHSLNRNSESLLENQAM